jgi:hypothetical protein
MSKDYAGKTVPEFTPIVEQVASAEGDGFTVVIDDRRSDEATDHAWRQQDNGKPGFLRWRVFKIENYDEKDHPCYWRKGSDGNFDTVTDPEGAEWQAEGTVKWDGCCNWTTPEHVNVHACGPEELRAFLEAIQRGYALAAEHSDGLKELLAGE